MQAALMKMCEKIDSNLHHPNYTEHNLQLTYHGVSFT